MGICALYFPRNHHFDRAKCVRQLLNMLRQQNLLPLTRTRRGRVTARELVHCQKICDDVVPLLLQGGATEVFAVLAVSTDRTVVTGKGEVRIRAKNFDDTAAVVTQCRYAGKILGGLACTKFQREAARILDK